MLTAVKTTSFFPQDKAFMVFFLTESQIFTRENPAPPEKKTQNKILPFWVGDI